MTRREVLAALTAAPALNAQRGGRPELRALVERHSPVYRRFDPAAPLSVGNGEFAFTADCTGLQTFPDVYDETVPLCTMSQWGWHSFPRAHPEELHLTQYETYGRKVGYPTKPDAQRELFDWLRENPHRLNLARIGFVLANLSDITEIDQKLDLWNGQLESRFLLAGEPVAVQTCVHPEVDALAIRIFSQTNLPISISFPYGATNLSGADWKLPDRHQSTLTRTGARRYSIERKLDNDGYQVNALWEGEAELSPGGPHRWTLRPSTANFALVVAFNAAAPPPKETFAAASQHWNAFWRDGMALDFSAASDARAHEIERRVVLSQYLTAIQCAGSLPPQETGLTCNSWYGKFHLEMHWWHAAHFPLWGRPPLLERSLAWYARILPKARDWAKQQGYQGARWPKMVGPEGRDSPSPIGPLLIWQQPHPIAMAELVYRANPQRATLDKYRDIVFASADFLASFAVLKDGRYVLGPPVIPAQENHPPNETWNPTFELEYWDYALGVAQQWRERLHLPPDPHWADVRERLSPLPVRDGVYLAHENCPQTFTERNRDHPSMLAALAILPGRKVDRDTMRRTYEKVLKTWKFEDTWGWDYPMMAMTASRLGNPEAAVQALLMETPKNTWQPNGHNFQRKNLPLYLPSNGGLLMAAATIDFPKSWSVARSAPVLRP